jgi:hypothetical protein
LTRRAFSLLLCLAVMACHSGPVITTFDGRYTGEAVNTSPAVYNCEATTTTSPMTVSGGEVTFGLLRGRVTPAGTVQMQSQQNTLSGQFSGNHFTGQFNMGTFSAPGIFCTYSLDMARQ